MLVRFGADDGLRRCEAHAALIAMTRRLSSFALFSTTNPRGISACSRAESVAARMWCRLFGSGTSRGLNAALNGLLNFSVLDGWWIEACIEGVAGWSIGHDGDGADRTPPISTNSSTRPCCLFSMQTRRDGSRRSATSHINSTAQRMMRRYATEAYLR